MNLRSALTLAAFSLLAITAQGCATLFTGSHDNIAFSSEPPGAEVLIDGLVVGRTPTTVSVKRPGLGDKMVTLRMDGYDPVTFSLSKGFNTVAVLNLASVLGWGIDILTGSVMKYDRHAYDVDMDRGAVSFNLRELPTTEGGVYVLPDLEDSVSVLDEERGLSFVFER